MPYERRAQHLRQPRAAGAGHGAVQSGHGTALQVVARTSVFTTHTPVAAGHDEFPTDMVRPYIKSQARSADDPKRRCWPGAAPANAHPHGPFSMFILGLRLSQHCNGVSRLHGRVARRMWTHVWPDRSGRGPRSRMSPTASIIRASSRPNRHAFRALSGPRMALQQPQSRKTSNASTKSTMKSCGAPMR
jgi:hypothetical protein